MSRHAIARNVDRGPVNPFMLGVAIGLVVIALVFGLT